MSGLRRQPSGPPPNGGGSPSSSSDAAPAPAAAASRHSHSSSQSSRQAPQLVRPAPQLAASSNAAPPLSPTSLARGNDGGGGGNSATSSSSASRRSDQSTTAAPPTMASSASLTGVTSNESNALRSNVLQRADGDRSAAPATTDVSEAVYSFRLLEALRKGDQKALHPFLAKGAARPGPVKELTSPLHLAVRCAEYQTIALCLEYKSASLNVGDAQFGNTPLHLASMIGRADVVKLFLQQDDVDDTARNLDGRDALDVSKSLDIAQLIQVSRAQLNVTFLETLERWERDVAGAYDELLALLARPRIGVVDLNAQTRSGTTLLHEAVRRKDTRMIEAAVRRGADVFCRNKRGKRVLESTKDEKVKALLQQLSNADAALAAQNSAGSGLPPIFRGYLSKWTNAIGGYKTRWFVLENGILSYYHSQDDEGKQSRGSYNLRYAKIRADANDRHRFEVVSEPSSAKGQPNKLYLRGSHPVERARWVQVLQQTVDFFELDRVNSRGEGGLYNLRGGSQLSLAESAGGGGAAGAAAAAATAANTQSSNVPAGTKGVIVPGAGVPSRSTTPFRGTVSNPSVSTVPETEALGPQRSTTPFQADLSTSNGNGTAGSRTPASLRGQGGDKARSFIKTPSIMSRDSRSPSDEPILDGAVTADGTALLPSMPHREELPLVSNLLRTQLGLACQLAAAGAPGAADDAARAALLEALNNSSALLAQYQDIVHQREAYLLRRYEQEIQAKLLWEENIQTLARQQAELETQLQEVAEDNARKRKVLREVRENFGSIAGGAGVAAAAGAAAAAPVAVSAQFGSLDLSSPGPTRRDTQATLTAPPAQGERRVGSFSLPAGLAAESDDDEDEFFETAADEEALQQLPIVDEPLRQASLPPEFPERFDSTLVDEAEYEPYNHLRDHMPIGKDERPSMSLWAVLKNNIGKDLTKIAFPVSFNEPTSMLERMAEDMEYSTCLDAAAAQQDSTLRTAFVAAFAMSNYSSTQGRIAKPFNPLLSETFEYVRPDRKYRYVSEQVSHHPPTSACLAESPYWEYSGSVDAKNRFSGKAFEIKPTGAAFINLKLPREYLEGATSRPLKPAPSFPDRVLEHYSWNKVTTVVSGFLMGSITISHEGEMVVTNHTTGDVCRLTFKPRGWRAKDANEIRGSVTSGRTGAVVWDIAGKWTTQLVARRARDGQQELATDADASAGQQAATGEELILLWKAFEKPPLPFNLTNFAITLNSLPPGLEKALPPTDCRMRPDLVAFEHGRFDEANTLKANLEQFQRETRKKREEGQLPPHKPLYFTKITDDVTGEAKWEAIREKNERGVAEPKYWRERSLAARDDADAERKWKDAPRIFGPYVASRHKDD